MALIVTSHRVMGRCRWLNNCGEHGYSTIWAAGVLFYQWRASLSAAVTGDNWRSAAGCGAPYHNHPALKPGISHPSL